MRPAVGGTLAILFLLASCEVPEGERVIGYQDGGDATVASAMPTAEACCPPRPGEALPPLQASLAEPVLAFLPLHGCTSDMILIEGKFCPVVEQDCVRWLESPDKTPFARCARFEAHPLCKAERTALRFCIDRLEASGEKSLPISNISWIDAAAICKNGGKRLCQEHEWTFACEGEGMSPYPYGTTRNPALCNFDRTSLVKRGKLIDGRQSVTDHPKCLSSFGVQNMVGNVDEWVVLDEPFVSPRGEKMLSGLKGGWWGPMRDGCRPVTAGHDPHFHELQIGFRCCADAR